MFNRGHRLTFFPEFHADLSRYKEMRIHYTHYKKHPPPFYAPLAQGAKILTREIWVRPTYACRMLCLPELFAKSWFWAITARRELSVEWIPHVHAAFKSTHCHYRWVAGECQYVQYVTPLLAIVPVQLQTCMHGLAQRTAMHQLHCGGKTTTVWYPICSPVITSNIWTTLLCSTAPKISWKSVRNFSSYNGINKQTGLNT